MYADIKGGKYTCKPVTHVMNSYDYLDSCYKDLCVFVLQVLYKEEFEKNKGKGFSVVADTPELQRIKKTQDQISNVGPTPVYFSLLTYYSLFCASYFLFF